MRAACSVPCIGFGLSREATFRGEILKMGLDGTTFRIRTPRGQATIRTVLCGQHNVLNWLGAIAAGLHFGATLEEVQRAAAAFSGVPGRLEPVRCGQRFHVFVDFAHTPQALSATLTLLRRHVSGRLIALFGQAGNRDAHNRSRMARAVSDHADLAVVTNDDPYDDDPQEIVDDLGRELSRTGWRENAEFWKIVDRREAIHWAIGLARRGDCVLLAGRGPEDVTVIAGRKIPLSDSEVACEALQPKSAA
jgi:UDP-N-acetylmuramoyl-L-alanyl-D-glutamate--2,6-diaminopimelate ligase